MLASAASGCSAFHAARLPGRWSLRISASSLSGRLCSNPSCPGALASHCLRASCPACTALQYVLADRLQDSHAALASLPRLETVCWRGRSYSDEYASEQALPGGPWLSRLRRLVMPAPTLAQAASLEALSKARQLEQLGVSCTTWIQHLATRLRPVKVYRKQMYRDAAVLRILEWVATHPSLQLLVLQHMSQAMHTAAAAAQQRLHGLRVSQDDDVCGAVCSYRTFADE